MRIRWNHRNPPQLISSSSSIFKWFFQKWLTIWNRTRFKLKCVVMNIIKNWIYILTTFDSKPPRFIWFVAPMFFSERFLSTRRNISSIELQKRKTVSLIGLCVHLKAANELLTCYFSDNLHTQSEMHARDRLFMHTRLMLKRRALHRKRNDEWSSND